MAATLRLCTPGPETGSIAKLQLIDESLGKPGVLNGWGHNLSVITMSCMLHSGCHCPRPYVIAAIIMMGLE